MANITGHKNFHQEFENITCSVCMECPHNAVLLLCSSHDKGCLPYMCGTSSRYSNCLHQYKKAQTKRNGLLLCPLCRGRVKGCTVVGPAREYFNSKKRSCTDDKCTFMGTYREMRQHVRGEHPCTKPREVGPTVEDEGIYGNSLEGIPEDLMSWILHLEAYGSTTGPNIDMRRQEQSPTRSIEVLRG